MQGMPKVLKGMPQNGQYYKILTKLEEMLTWLKSCNHHGFGEKKARIMWLIKKKLSVERVSGTINSILLGG